MQAGLTERDCLVDHDVFSRIEEVCANVEMVCRRGTLDLKLKRLIELLQMRLTREATSDGH